MVYIIFTLHQLFQRFHFLPGPVRTIPPLFLRPVYTHLEAICESRLILHVDRAKWWLSLLGHPLGRWSTLLLNHGKVLHFLAGLIKELTRIHLYQDANHRPDVTFLCPVFAIENDLWSSVLTRVYYWVVLFVIIGGTAEIDDFDCVIEWTHPYAATWFFVARVDGLFDFGYLDIKCIFLSWLPLWGFSCRSLSLLLLHVEGRIMKFLNTARAAFWISMRWIIESGRRRWWLLRWLNWHIDLLYLHLTIYRWVNLWLHLLSIILWLFLYDVGHHFSQIILR